MVGELLGPWHAATGIKTEAFTLRIKEFADVVLQVFGATEG